MNGEEPRRRRMTILMLPNDLVYNCLARVSRLHYLTLSLVSKRFRSLLASSELYQTRTLLNRTESCLYVCLRLCTGSQPLRWFTLCRVPSNSKKFLVPISSPSSPSALWSNAVMVGPNIYTIGGLVNKNASSSVTVMDCRSHTWREAAPMRVARVFQSSCVLDGKIYVTGGCENLDLTNWMEVFDTKAQTWEFLQIPNEEIFGGAEYNSIGYEGTVYVRSDDKDVTYKLHKGRWTTADLAINSGWARSSSYCVIEKVFYRSGGKTIEWYDSKERSWKILKGLEKLHTLTRFAHLNLVNYGGKMVVVWEKYVVDKNHKETMIWCAEIAIEKRQKREIWGMLEWVDIVLSIESYGLVHVLANTI
ncbi:PREDICTED: F-box/kelch-repeat protein At4g23580-like [Camelina sativa]|uniref:F-box/kelch-repeat protein At4g23580-like n=1 Tax=Camelina sativa TaxID=90675 RepID=A0ABM0WAG4_CAMSA|nr:PREDICTED: F-box/kelch-repeat protein At4g23580-like [Camelina sativa]